MRGAKRGCLQAGPWPASKRANAVLTKLVPGETGAGLIDVGEADLAFLEEKRRALGNLAEAAIDAFLAPSAGLGLACHRKAGEQMSDIASTRARRSEKQHRLKRAHLPWAPRLELFRRAPRSG